MSLDTNPDSDPSPVSSDPNQYLQRGVLIDIDLLDDDDLNPNVMSERQFNGLVENIKRAGLTDMPLVRPMPNGRYRIVGGHHRKDACKILGYTKIPCTVNTDPNFDQEQAHFQLMKHNMLHGRLSAQKFMKLYEQYQAKYTREQLADLFGFESEDVLEKLIKAAEKGLPNELKAQFKKAKAEIKTVEDLAKILNHLFSTYGSTLPFGYMVVDFGGKESVWLRMHPSDRKNFDVLADRCQAAGKSVDGAVRILLQLIAGGQLEQFEKSFPLLPAVKVEEGKPPLEENASQVQEEHP